LRGWARVVRAGAGGVARDVGEDDCHLIGQQAKAASDFGPQHHAAVFGQQGG